MESETRGVGELPTEGKILRRKRRGENEPCTNCTWVALSEKAWEGEGGGEGREGGGTIGISLV